MDENKKLVMELARDILIAKINVSTGDVSLGYGKYISNEYNSLFDEIYKHISECPK